MKKEDIVSTVGWVLLAAGLGFYGYGIYEAVRLSLGPDDIKEGAFPAPLALFVSLLQTSLLTNFGILLGISFAKPDSALARQMLFVSSKKIAVEKQKSPLELMDRVQLFAALVYIISLIICTVFWLKEKFDVNPKHVEPLISESGKMFFGIIVAYILVVFKREPTPSSPAKL